MLRHWGEERPGLVVSGLPGGGDPLTPTRRANELSRANELNGGSPMRLDGVHLTGVGAELGIPVRISALVRRGVVSVEATYRTRYRSICVSVASGPEIAAAAAGVAVRCHEQVTGVASQIQGHIHLQRAIDYPEGGGAAAQVQALLGRAGCGVTCEIGASTSGVLGLEIAARLITVRPELDTVLVTTGDRAAGRFVRYDPDLGVIHGDAGGALVLSRLPGIADVLSVVTCTDTGSATSTGNATSVGSRSAATAMGIALMDAGIAIKDVRWILVPFVGYEAVHAWWHDSPIVQTDPGDRTLTPLGLHVGHLGAADHIVGLRHLIATGLVGPGDHVVLASSGAGRTWSTAVMRITDTQQ